MEEFPIGKKPIRASCRVIGTVLVDIQFLYYQHRADFFPSGEHTSEH